MAGADEPAIERKLDRIRSLRLEEQPTDVDLGTILSERKMEEAVNILGSST
jgi:hypothetical protein